MIRGVPHDLQLEREVLGSILSGYATCTSVAPRHFYLPAHATILRAWRQAGRPAGRYIGIRDGDEILIGLAFDGLERQLVALDPTSVERLVVRAALAAADAPVTTRHDSACLRLLAYRRRRLKAIEDERLTLLGGDAR